MIGTARYILVDRNTYERVLDRTPYEGAICWPLMRLRWVY
jgi:hypothetical protein